jgi:AcrR family transcriptional regulator
MKPTTRRAEKAAARREAIVAAALDEFSEKGFAAARIEDVARRAGSAKGTVYLYFASKEALFEAILQQQLVPVVQGLGALAPQPGEPTRAVAKRLALTLAAGLKDSRRAAVVRLVIAEGPRFPRLAEIYYRTVVEAGLAFARDLAHRADAAGELRADAMVRLPQLLIAPVLVGLIWNSLFQRFEPLDAAALIEAQLDLLFQPAGSVDRNS